MFQTISRLLFGGEEQTPVEVKSVDGAEEEWLVIGHVDTISGENQIAELLDPQPPNSALHGDSAANMEDDVGVSEIDSTDPSRITTRRRVTDSISSAKALLGATHSTCIQKTRTWADRHHMTRNATHRQNLIRQGVQKNLFHLQQPGHCKLSH